MVSKGVVFGGLILLLSLKRAQSEILVQISPSKINVAEYQTTNITLNFHCSLDTDSEEVQPNNGCASKEVHLEVDSWHIKWENVSADSVSTRRSMTLWTPPELKTNQNATRRVFFTPEMLGIYRLQMHSLSNVQRLETIWPDEYLFQKTTMNLDFQC